jgi:arylsulfatase A-like enzyme
MRVPGIFRWPGRIPAGVTTAEVASTADVLPTLAELAGVELPDRILDGRSIAPVLTGAADTVGERLFCYYFGVQLQAVRLGRWKLLLRVEEYPDGVDSLWYRTNPALFERHHRMLEKPELYDLVEDIAESKNLAGERGDVVERLATMAREYDRALQADIHLRAESSSHR